MVKETLITNSRCDEAKRRLRTGLDVLATRPGAPIRLQEPFFSEKLLDLMALVLDYNEEINLTSITDSVEFVELHILDSLSCSGLESIEKATKIVDIGSGGGFPGLPLALLYPEKRFLLIDSLRKRIEIVGKIARELGAKNVNILHSRAESAGRNQEYREVFDLALCRAVGAFRVVLEYGVPMIRVGGRVFAYKTIQAEVEIEDARMALKQLGCAADVEVFCYPELLPGRNHALYIATKKRKTPEMYPRREGLPAKVPL